MLEIKYNVFCIHDLLLQIILGYPNGNFHHKKVSIYFIQTCAYMRAAKFVLK